MTDLTPEREQHGMQVCPRCSTSVPMPIQQPEPAPFVDHIALQTQAWHRIAAALERIADKLSEENDG